MHKSLLVQVCCCHKRKKVLRGFHAAYLERIMFSSEACGNFAIHYSFKVKCAKNLYQDVSSGMLLTLKVFCMAKLAVDLDVDIPLSKYGFNANI